MLHKNNQDKYKKRTSFAIYVKKHIVPYMGYIGSRLVQNITVLCVVSQVFYVCLLRKCNFLGIRQFQTILLRIKGNYNKKIYVFKSDINESTAVSCESAKSLWFGLTSKRREKRKEREESRKCSRLSVHGFYNYVY